jgi:hypothetical protein
MTFITSDFCAGRFLAGMIRLIKKSHGQVGVLLDHVRT